MPFQLLFSGSHMPRKATSLDEQMLLEACRFGGNDSVISEYLKQIRFETSTLQQALITIQASGHNQDSVISSQSFQKIDRRIRRRMK